MGRLELEWTDCTPQDKWLSAPSCTYVNIEPCHDDADRLRFMGYKHVRAMRAHLCCLIRKRFASEIVGTRKANTLLKRRHSGTVYAHLFGTALARFCAVYSLALISSCWNVYMVSFTVCWWISVVSYTEYESMWFRVVNIGCFFFLHLFSISAVCLNSEQTSTKYTQTDNTHTFL